MEQNHINTLLKLAEGMRISGLDRSMITRPRLCMDSGTRLPGRNPGSDILMSVRCWTSYLMSLCISTSTYIEDSSEH